MQTGFAFKPGLPCKRVLAIEVSPLLRLASCWNINTQPAGTGSRQFPPRLCVLPHHGVYSHLLDDCTAHLAPIITDNHESTSMSIPRLQNLVVHGTVNVVGGHQINAGAPPLPALNNVRLMARFWHLECGPAVQRHRVGIFTDPFCPNVGFPYQPSRTDSAVARSMRRHAGTSNAGRKFASLVLSTGFN